MTPAVTDASSGGGATDPDRVVGRFAPSPTGVLHLGNLRTALISWCAARSVGGRWLIRMEDLDPVTSSTAHEQRQLEHLARLGMTSDELIVRQSERFERYRTAIAQLDAAGAVYPCYCTRREIREAATAPHGHGPQADGLPDGAYPGTCRELTATRRSVLEREGRRSALRLRTHGERYGFHDLVLGQVDGGVDDVVLQRNDGVPAYNLAVVVDDHLQGVDQVVRGDDLATSTPRQMHLQHLLGFSHPVYAHVPLVVGDDGQRLAKRHGAVTLDDLGARGIGDAAVLALLARSIGLDPSLDEPIEDLAARFSFGTLPHEPWRFGLAELEVGLLEPGQLEPGQLEPGRADRGRLGPDAADRPS